MIAAVLTKPGSGITALSLFVSTVVSICLWFSLSHYSPDDQEINDSLSNLLPLSKKRSWTKFMWPNGSVSIPLSGRYRLSSNSLSGTLLMVTIWSWWLLESILWFSVLIKRPDERVSLNVSCVSCRCANFVTPLAGFFSPSSKLKYWTLGTVPTNKLYIDTCEREENCNYWVEFRHESTKFWSRQSCKLVLKLQDYIFVHFGKMRVLWWIIREVEKLKNLNFGAYIFINVYCIDSI